MRTIGLLIVTAALGMFPGAVRAVEAYHVVKIWPELPQGWHFLRPVGVAVDPSGSVYVGDSGNYRIKKFSPEGRLITQWGSPGPGDGQFSTIKSVMLGRSGTVYILDEYNRGGIHSRIQKFTPYGQFVGFLERKAPGTDKTDLAVALAVDNGGNIFVLAVDSSKGLPVPCAAVEKYSPDGEFITRWETGTGNDEGRLEIPLAITVDVKGNYYIVDTGTDSVRKFDASGTFIRKWGTRGEDAGASSLPCSVALDKAGELYVLDSHGVQKFTAEGKSLGGWKVKDGPFGIAVDPHSNVYVACRGANTIRIFDSTGNTVSEWGNTNTGDGRFGEPGSIAVEPSGGIAVVDGDSIQRFNSEGGFVSRWGGFTRPMVMDLATDASGNLYAACGDANEVQKFNSDGRLICRWGRSGRGDGEFWFSRAIAVGPSGHVYVADTFNHRVQKFADDGAFLAKWGTKGTGEGQFEEPFFIAADDSGSVWVADQLGDGTHRMQRFDADGGFLMQWTRKILKPRWTNFIGAVTVDSSGNSYYVFDDRIEKYDAEGKLTGAYGQEAFARDKLERVYDLCVDRAGSVYVAGPTDQHSLSLSAGGSIRKFDAAGKLVGTWSAADAEGLPNGPITVDSTGNVYAARLAGTSIQKLSSDGRPVAKFRIAASREGRFSDLGGVAVDRAGKIYAVDSIDVGWGYGIPSIKEFDVDGRSVTVWEQPESAEDRIRHPAFIAADGAGHIFITDKGSHCVHELDAQGRYVRTWGEKGAGDGQFDTPEGIAVDGSGHVYVCDRQNSRIQKFDSDGRFLAKWGKEGSGDGEFHFPAAVAVDRGGSVFVADSDNHRVQKFTADGRFLTKWGEFGEAPGQFNVPLGIAVDQEGNVYVSDSHNQRIQKFAPARSQ